MTLSSMGVADWLNDIRASLNGVGGGEVPSLRQDDEGCQGETSEQGSDGALDSDNDETENDSTPDEKNTNMEPDDADNDKEMNEGKDVSEGC